MRFAALILVVSGWLHAAQPHAAGIQAGVWDATADDLCVPILRVAVPSASPAAIVAAFNQQFPRPGLRLRRTAGRQAVVEVVDGDYLTQRMGSTGAAMYLISATFSLTSAAGVDRVQFIFEEGDHAVPGVFTRASALSSFGCKPAGG